MILYGMGEAGVWSGAKSYPIIIEWALKALKFAKVLKVDESIPNAKIFRNQNYRIILMSVDTEYIFQKLWKILPIGIFFCSMMCSYCNLWSTQLCLIVIWKLYSWNLSQTWNLLEFLKTNSIINYCLPRRDLELNLFQNLIFIEQGQILHICKKI